MNVLKECIWIMFYVCFGFCSFSTSLHQRNGQMGRRPVLTNAFRSHFVTESTDAQSIRDGALCPDHQPLSTFGRTNCNSLSHNSHEAFSGLWGDLFLPKRCWTGGRGGSVGDIQVLEWRQWPIQASLWLQAFILANVLGHLCIPCMQKICI